MPGISVDPDHVPECRARRRRIQRLQLAEQPVRGALVSATMSCCVPKCSRRSAVHGGDLGAVGDGILQDPVFRGRKAGRKVGRV